MEVHRIWSGRQALVPVGAPWNICLSKDERYASIMRMKPDGSELEVFAKGVRNSVSFGSPIMAVTKWGMTCHLTNSIELPAKGCTLAILIATEMGFQTLSLEKGVIARAQSF